ncbi:MAG: hypothetical protein JW956_06175 [Calditrichaceae bacterium]|nr:hypothetical protein [Calditrichaceae bacterium]
MHNCHLLSAVAGPADVTCPENSGRHWSVVNSHLWLLIAGYSLFVIQPYDNRLLRTQNGKLDKNYTGYYSLHTPISGMVGLSGLLYRTAYPDRRVMTSGFAVRITAI